MSYIIGVVFKLNAKLFGVVLIVFFFFFVKEYKFFFGVDISFNCWRI